jgi:RimJ/RimL family protein N-acetyltransferase
MPDLETLEPGVLTEAVARVRHAVIHHGWAGCLRLAALHAGRLAYLRESHVWYWLDLRQGGPRIDLPAGLRLIRARGAEVGLLEQLPAVSTAEARRRLTDGAELWMVLDAGRPVFACWTFGGRMPACAGLRASFDLPAGAVGLDDAITAPDLRGHRIAPAAWSAIVSTLADEGADAVVARVDETNVPGRRAIEKVGFRAVASMEFERIGGRCTVDVQSYDAGGVGRLLADRLAR